MESWLTWATWHCVITDILTKLPELSGIWLMVGLVLKLLLRFGCQHEVSWSSKLALIFLLFALLVVSKVPFEDLQVWPYIAPSLHRFTALMKSHQIHPDPTIVTALSQAMLSATCCPRKTWWLWILGLFNGFFPAYCLAEKKCSSVRLLTARFFSW